MTRIKQLFHISIIITLLVLIVLASSCTPAVAQNIVYKDLLHMTVLGDSTKLIDSATKNVIVQKEIVTPKYVFKPTTIALKLEAQEKERTLAIKYGSIEVYSGVWYNVLWRQIITPDDNQTIYWFDGKLSIINVCTFADRTRFSPQGLIDSYRNHFQW